MYELIQIAENSYYIQKSHTKKNQIPFFVTLIRSAKYGIYQKCDYHWRENKSACSENSRCAFVYPLAQKSVQITEAVNA